MHYFSLPRIHLLVLCLTLMLCHSIRGDCCKADCNAKCHTLYLPRSTHANSTYFLTYPRLDNALHIVTSCVEAGYLHEQSFLADDIATCLVGQPQLSFAGSQVTTRQSTDLLADQFGLSPSYVGAAKLQPTISNNSFHLQGIWYSPPDEEGCGLFARGQLSVTQQSRSLFNTDCSTTFEDIITGSAFPPGAMGPDTVLAAPDLQVALAGRRVYGNVTTPWQAGRFTFGPLSDTQLAGITFDVGYSAIHHDIHAYSFFFRVRPPTGTRIDGSQEGAQSLFFPIIGQGRHWEVGGGASMSGELWSDEIGRSVVMHAEGYVTHLFTNCQKRSFDLTGRGCLSRYMLLKSFNAQTGQPRSEIVPAINLTTRMVNVSLPALGEVAVQLLYQGTQGSMMIGYEFYGQMEEKVCIRNFSFTRDGTAYAIKGCQGAYYFAYTIDGTETVTGHNTDFIVPLNATSTFSTITTCSDTDVAGGVATQTATIVGVAWNNPYTGNGVAADAITVGTTVDSVAAAYASDVPQFLGPSDLNICSGTAPKQAVHKGVIAFTYCWNILKPSPYVSVGFSAEGSGRTCSLKQWGLWIKGGLSF